MKKVLVLGSGLVVKPGVQYLAKNSFDVTLATRSVSKAHTLISQIYKDENKETGSFKITPVTCDVSKDTNLEELVSQNEYIISLLPYNFHVQVAKLAIKHKKHFFTTSYVSEEMAKLQDSAKEAGVLVINECGVDPGTDHMSAMRVIDEVKKNGGKIKSFYSFCGGLPCPEDNDNPLGYKFSWSPRGVLLASKNPANFLKDGKDVTIPGEDLFDNYHVEDIEGLGQFEGYPNRNSKQYIDVYGINETETIMRGTFRNVGWCSTIKKISDLGYLSIEESEDYAGKTYAEVMKGVLGTENDVVKECSAKLNLKEDDKIIAAMKWLGLFSDEVVPAGNKTLLDALCHLCQTKMVYKEGERDMLLMQHKYTADYEDRTEYLTTTMVNYGFKNGDTSMSRTVSLPVSIAVRLVAEGKVEGLTGLHIPIIPELYNPILDELETLGVEYIDRTVKVEKK